MEVRTKTLGFAAQLCGGWVATGVTLIIAQVAGQGQNNTILSLMVCLAAIEGCQLVNNEIIAAIESKDSSSKWNSSLLLNGVGAYLGVLGVSTLDRDGPAISGLGLTVIWLGLFYYLQVGRIASRRYYEYLSGTQEGIKKTGLIFGLTGAGSLQVIMAMMVVTAYMGIINQSGLLVAGLIVPPTVQFIYIYEMTKNRQKRRRASKVARRLRFDVELRVTTIGVVMTILTLISTDVRMEAIANTGGYSNLMFYGISGITSHALMSIILSLKVSKTGYIGILDTQSGKLNVSQTRLTLSHPERDVLGHYLMLVGRSDL